MNGVKRRSRLFEPSLSELKPAIRRMLTTRTKDTWYVVLDVPFISSTKNPTNCRTLIIHPPTTFSTVSTAEKTTFLDELARFLASLTESTRDPLRWWVERWAIYPCLSRMALDYLSVPGMSHFHLIKFILLIGL